ncbi:MAG: hypothetical protein K6G88_12045 [Lachnospiraceae bacterium]|nr:hypothetical protein [Lachnospiraceae bacterium]
MWGFIVWDCFLLILYVTTFFYRRSDREKYKSCSRLWMLYGTAMFVADYVIKKTVHRNMNRVKKRISEINAKEKTESETYLYVVDKIAIVVLVIVISSALSTVTKLKYIKDNKMIREVTREELIENDMDIDAYIDGEKETFSIEIMPREYTESEAHEKLDAAAKQLEQIMLNDNESCSHVDCNLNLCESIQGSNITVGWELENTDVIDENGVICEGVQESGTDIEITATLHFKQYTKAVNYNLKVFPKSDNSNIGYFVQRVIDREARTKSKIRLPQKYNGKAIIYYEKQNDVGIIFLLLGFFVGIAVFILKDRDLDRDICKRNEEMAADYPEIVSNTMLLLKAGMSFQHAWEIILKMNSDKNNRYAYREMKNTLYKIRGGVSEYIALEQFGKNCAIHSYVRFSNIINQNIRRGSEDICKSLEEELERALSEKKGNALKMGEAAGTKLLVPMIIHLIICIVLIIVPAFLSVNGNL